MEKKTFQKPEVKFVQLNTLNILQTSGTDIDNEGNGDLDAVKSFKSSTSKGASIPTSSSANWD